VFFLRTVTGGTVGGMEDPNLVLPPAHLKELLNTLRKKVAQRIPGGAAGLMRCWLSFKQRCGSSKTGITYEEFRHGLTHGYGMPLEERQMKALFRKMDENGDGGIEMGEWIDVIMGRWNPTANTHFGSKSAGDISGGNRGEILGQLAIKENEDEQMTAEKAIVRLRVAIGQRIPVGGLIKCWTEFRQRAGSAKNGVLYEEFKRALRAYGILMPREASVTLFRSMDKNNDGTIQMREFIDVVMGRWKPTANTHFGGKTEEEIKGKDGEGAARGRAAMVEHVDPRLTVDEAIKQLRNAITQRIKSCNQGELIRCWIEFRTKTGASKEGVTLSEFRRGLRTYGIPLSAERMDEMYQRFDENGDGQIQMKEFIDVVIGRDNGSYQTNHKFRQAMLEDEELLSPNSKKKEKKKRLSKELMPPTWKPLEAQANELLARAQAELDEKKKALPVPAPNTMIDMTNAWVDPTSARASAAEVRAQTAEAGGRPMTGARRPSSRAVDAAVANTPMGVSKPLVRPFSAAATGPATQTPPESARPSTGLQRKPPLPSTNPALVLATSGRAKTVKPPRKFTGRNKPPRSLAQSKSLDSLRRGAKQNQLVPLAVRQFLETSADKGPDGETSLLPMRTLQHHGSRLLGLPTQSLPPSPIKGVRS